MKSEFLRISSLSVESRQPDKVSNVSFSVYKGEFLALVGRTFSGTKTLSLVLTKNIDDYQGEVLLCEKKKELREFRSSFSSGIAEINGLAAARDSYSVLERLCLIHNDRPMTAIVNERYIEEEFRISLEKLGMTDHFSEDLWTRVNSLSHFKLYLLELIERYMSGTELIILSNVFYACSKSELKVLTGVIRKMMDEGISFIYLYDDYIKDIDPIISRIIVMRHGQIAYTLEKEKGGFDYQKLNIIVNGSRKDEFPRGNGGGRETTKILSVSSKDDGNASLFSNSEINGLYDQRARIPYMTEELIAYVRNSYDLQLNGEMIRVRDTVDMVRKSIAVISRNPSVDIIRNLSPSENVSIFLSHRIRSVFFNQRISDYVFREVTQQYDYLRNIRDLEQRKNCYNIPDNQMVELSVAKWLAIDPEIVIFYMLTETFQQKEQEVSRQLYEQLRDEGRIVIVLSPNRQFLEYTCDRVTELRP